MAQSWPWGSQIAVKKNKKKLKYLEKEVQAKVSFTLQKTKPPNDSPTKSDKNTRKVLQT